MNRPNMLQPWSDAKDLAEPEAIQTLSIGIHWTSDVMRALQHAYVGIPHNTLQASFMFTR